MTPMDRALADALIAARNGGPLIETSKTPPPDDWAAVQTVVMPMTGPAGAFKAGAADTVAATTFAPIPANAVRPNGALIPAAGSRLYGVELEIGFTLLVEPPAPDDPDFDAVLAARLAMVPAIEIVETRLDDHMNAHPLLKLADCSANAGLVVGSPLSDWRSVALDKPNARFTIGDAVVWDGPSQVPGGDAFVTVARFVKAVGQHCGGLKPGHTIITGALTGLLYAKAGDAVVGQIDGLGTVEAKFA